MSDRRDEPGPPADEAVAVVVALAHVEGRLARPFADRGTILAEASLDESGLARLRRETSGLLAQADAGPLRAAFQRAFDLARKHDRRAPLRAVARSSPRSEPPPPPFAAGNVPEVGRPMPSYLRASHAPEDRASPASADAPDETVVLSMAGPGPTLPFVEGDARAFIEASRVHAGSTPGVRPTREDEDDAPEEPSPGDATQALDLRKLVEDVVPFELEVERSLTAFVDLLVALTEAPGREDEVGARFGVPTRTERERVLSGWRRRWDIEPALRAEWQRLYQLRAASTSEG